MPRKYWIYILSSNSGTLYIGITGNLERRVRQHKEGLVEGFSERYKCDRLVYYEVFADVRQAIRREKQLKGWVRKRKIALIESMNPRWEDFAQNWDKPMLMPGQSVKNGEEL